MRTLSIVVTCTDRKAVPPAPRLRARTLARTRGLGYRAESWRRRISAAVKNQLPLEQLYRGEAWAQVGVLARAAGTAGYRPTVWVASAGLGLRPVTSLAASYSATFRLGVDDSVAVDRIGAAQWWEEMASSPGAATVEGLGHRVLWVLSETYADALRDDLHRVVAGGGEMLLVGGAADIPGMTRLPADRALRPILGGTAGSLNLRTATAWLERLGTEPLTSPKALVKWRRWAQRTRQPEAWARRPLTDAEVMTFVRRQLRHAPDLSKTRALRLLRDAGLACEQKRFGDLYSRVRGGDR